jgi:hypothetical protein
LLVYIDVTKNRSNFWKQSLGSKDIYQCMIVIASKLVE